MMTQLKTVTRTDFNILTLYSCPHGRLGCVTALCGETRHKPAGLLPLFENAKCLHLKAFILEWHISHLSLQRERAEVRVSSACRRRRRSQKSAALKIEHRVMLVKTDRAQMIPFCAKCLLLKCLHPHRLRETPLDDCKRGGEGLLGRVEGCTQS